MSRHTKNDGITPHPEITAKSFSIWLQELAPRTSLVGDYYKRGLNWESFRAAYIDFLRESPQVEKTRDLTRQALTQDITIMCVEENPEHCHRRLLAEACQLVEPNLTIVIR